MTTTENKTKVIKDLNEKSILITREFDAPIELIWRAFTENEILERRLSWARNSIKDIARIEKRFYNQKTNSQNEQTNQIFNI